MTNLECTALNCINNHSRLCCLDDIEVCGSDACRCRETCCASFADENDAFGNVLDSREAAPETHIDCDAHRCIYNADGICDAEEVLIDGSFAHRKDATCCDSFIARD